MNTDDRTPLATPPNNFDLHAAECPAAAIAVAVAKEQK